MGTAKLASYDKAILTSSYEKKRDYSDLLVGLALGSTAHAASLLVLSTKRSVWNWETLGEFTFFAFLAVSLTLLSRNQIREFDKDLAAFERLQK